MLAKEVLRNSMDLNRRIKEQSVIYQDWKAMAMESMKMKYMRSWRQRGRSDCINSVETEAGRTYHGKSQCDQREILRLRYLYAATWDAIADELNDSVAWVKEQYQKALKKLSAETTESCKGCDCCAEEM